MLFFCLKFFTAPFCLQNKSWAPWDAIQGSSKSGLYWPFWLSQGHPLKWVPFPQWKLYKVKNFTCFMIWCSLIHRNYLISICWITNWVDKCMNIILLLIFIFYWYWLICSQNTPYSYLQIFAHAVLSSWNIDSASLFLANHSHLKDLAQKVWFCF